ncbi:MAG: polysaccharide biosynthesis/export family protein [Rhodospirillaceae bacterium]
MHEKSFSRLFVPPLLGAILAAMLWSAPADGQAINAEVPSNSTGAESGLAGYRLGSGDRIRLIVYGEPDLTGEFGIDGSGDLGVPLIGKVPAGNATATELEERIAERLTPDYLKNPSVTVEIVSYRPFYIVGEVRQPGSYAYVSGMTVINAVALGGGFTYRARESEFEIDRRIGNQVRNIEAKPATEVLPGDVITVAERFF